MIEITATWRTNHPGAAAGILSMAGIQSPGDHASLNDKKAALETELRRRYQDLDRSELKNLPEMNAYAAYYKRFKKTYHLLLQLESIVHKGKSIPAGPPLVQAMFMAELNSLLLTAGHDQSHIEAPFFLDSASGDEDYTLLSGNDVTCKAGDMVTRDQQGVFCSIIYGQDLRTRITNETQDVLYVVYVPPGIDPSVIDNHLNDLQENVKLVYHDAQVVGCDIYFA